LPTTTTTQPFPVGSKLGRATITACLAHDPSDFLAPYLYGLKGQFRDHPEWVVDVWVPVGEMVELPETGEP
jgi:hypothetical protein